MPFQPTNTDIVKVLAEINGKYDRVFAYNNVNGGYLSYNPQNPAASSLFTMEAGRGYWVRMNTAAQLTVSGVDPSKTIILEPGWNLVSYNGTTSKNITEVLAPIAGKYVRVYGWNSDMGRYEKYVASNPGQSDLFVMEPGKGYFIYATEITPWILP